MWNFYHSFFPLFTCELIVVTRSGPKIVAFVHKGFITKKTKCLVSFIYTTIKEQNYLFNFFIIVV